MNKYGLLLISCLLLFTMAACSSNSDRENVEQPDNGNVKDTPQKTTAETEEALAAASNEGRKTIVFSTFYESDFLKEAVKNYEAKHPNIAIQLTYAHAIGDDANWEANHEKFVKTTNTQMLTGKGPDLLEMDQLPMGQYVNKKMLMNLSEMMEKDPGFQKEQYFTNILDNVKLDGSVYGIPVRFYLYGLIGDEEAIKKTGITFDDNSWTWNQFIQTAKELAQQGGHEYAFFGDAIVLLNEMVNETYGQFVDPVNRKSNFESEAFTRLMKQVKTMIDEKVVNHQSRSDTFFRMDTITSIRSYILAGTQYMEMYNKPKLYSKPKAEGQQAGGFFRTETTIGIHAKSAVQKEAWDFIKYLISEETEPGGFPLNKQAYKKQVQQLLQVGSVKADEEGALKGKEFKVTEAHIQDLESYLYDAIHAVEYRPSKVEEIITEESAAFFGGQKSAELVAKLIQNRVSTYLNE
ncbi:ABC transporter substrate-binding protein [Paenibacillus eucommiae]|uniref:Multiple sugar transport system substrate-binding protein n=1 Tax=Paenibacillus eucommiae TaxID=1355755 RepID=A0ABS4IP76_9BACL|nr:extracellular solute-binding protein [Paenibacillus eucommiae]MBP1989367.1 multiple sugar transport system substrate-binding protein [Paenibacillus eucommiae]